MIYGMRYRDSISVFIFGITHIFIAKNDFCGLQY